MAAGRGWRRGGGESEAARAADRSRGGQGALGLASELLWAAREAAEHLVREMRSSTAYHVAEVAEAVETAELRHLLDSAGCSKMQADLGPGAQTPQGRPLRKIFGLGLPMLGLVVACIVVEASKGLLANWEIQTKMARGLEMPSVPLMVFVKNVVSVITGIVLAFAFAGRAGVATALNPLRVLVLLPSAALFAAAQVCSLLALHHFDVGSLKVFAQLSLPGTAVLSRLMLGRPYSWTQWQSMAFLALCSIAFIEVRILFETSAPSPLGLAVGLARPHGSSARGGSDLADALGPGGPLEGLGYVLLAVLFGSTASVMGERCLKRDRRAFYIQKCNLMLGECLASFLVLLAAPSLDHHHTPAEKVLSFAGWDWRTCLVVLVWLFHGWVAGMVAKQLSSLTKSIVHIISAMVSYAVATALWPRTPFFPRGLPAAMTALMVFLCVFIFVTIKPSKSPASAPARSETAASEWARASKYKCLPLMTRPRARAAMSLISGEVLLLTAFVLLEGTRPLLVSWAQQGGSSVRAFRNGTFVLTQTSTSFVLALAIAWTCEGSSSKAVQMCTAPLAILRQLPVACCFAVSKLALLTALSQLDAGTVRVMAQSGLPMVAFCSSLLGKHYSQHQWQAIWMIGLGVVTFFLVKAETERSNPVDFHTEQDDSAENVLASWKLRFSVLCVFVSLGTNCMGALSSERFLKSTVARTPYYAQKAHLLGGECLVNFGVCLCSWLCTAGAQDSSLLAYVTSGWDHRTVITMFVWIPSGWCATLVVKHCSVLSKNIAQSVGSLLTYFLSIQPITLVGPALTPQPVAMPALLLALVCIQGVVLFVVASAEEETLRQQKQLELHAEAMCNVSDELLLAPNMEDLATGTAVRRHATPIVSIDMWQHQFDDPLGQIDFVELSAPLLPKAPGEAARFHRADKNMAAVPSRGPGLLRVSSMGSDLCEFALQAPSGYERQCTPGDLPIGQTDFLGHYPMRRL